VQEPVLAGEPKTSAPQVRFAEEILRGEREEAPKKAKAKKATVKDDDEAVATKKARKPKRVVVEADEEDEEFDYSVR
jgi:hypothetical protein